MVLQTYGSTPADLNIPMKKQQKKRTLKVTI